MCAIVGSLKLDLKVHLLAFVCTLPVFAVFLLHSFIVISGMVVPFVVQADAQHHRQGQCRIRLWRIEYISPTLLPRLNPYIHFLLSTK